MSSPHLVLRLTNMAAAVPKPRIGEWDVPGLMREAAEEINRLRAYAIKLESPPRCGDHITRSREETGVNWMAIHGVDP